MNNTGGNKWPKAITVDKRIVRILSSSTYSNFPSAIREIIVNSYDADAEKVKVDFDLKNSIITILDDGKGMNESDFTFYLRIAGKTRKKEETKTKSDRKIIGQFGVGFLSVLPFCEKYLIETTKKGSSEVVNATITSSEYFDDELNAIDVDKIPINGSVKIDNNRRNESYTRIRLVGFSKLTKAFFKGEYTLKSKKNTVKNFKPLDLMKWELEEYLPLKYDISDNIGFRLNKFSEDKSIKPFEVLMDNKPLYRKIHAQNILDSSEEPITIGNITFKYFISTDYKPISPTEARHLLIRNLNIGVGSRTSFGIGMDGKVYGKLAHLTGEILVEDGLNDLISVSRDKFNYSVNYEKMKEFFRGKLRSLANELDEIKGAENFFEKFQDESKISNLENLKDDTFSKKIEKLKSSGFEVVEKISKIESIKEDSANSPGIIELNKREKKIQLNINPEDTYKQVNVGNRKYKLKVDEWNMNQSEYPAVMIKNDVVSINENYPLFKDKNKVDFFIKLNILLLKNLYEERISKNAYMSLMDDLLNTFKD